MDSVASSFSSGDATAEWYVLATTDAAEASSSYCAHESWMLEGSALHVQALQYDAASASWSGANATWAEASVGKFADGARRAVVWMAGVDENEGAADDDDDGCLEPGLDDVCGGHEWLAVYECGGASAPAVRLLKSNSNAATKAELAAVRARLATTRLVSGATLRETDQSGCVELGYKWYADKYTPS